jgi:hypothetical protein
VAFPRSVQGARQQQHPALPQEADGHSHRLPRHSKQSGSLPPSTRRLCLTPISSVAGIRARSFASRGLCGWKLSPPSPLFADESRLVKRPIGSLPV